MFATDGDIVVNNLTIYGVRFEWWYGYRYDVGRDGIGWNYWLFQESLKHE